MKKRFWIALTLVFTLLLSSVPVFAADIKIYIDGQELVTDAPPVIVDGSTLVPMRAIFEALGATVSYDATAQQVTGTKEGTTIQLVINAKSALKNGVVVQLAVAPQIVDGRTMVPLRFVSDVV